MNRRKIIQKQLVVALGIFLTGVLLLCPAPQYRTTENDACTKKRSFADNTNTSDAEETHHMLKAHTDFMGSPPINFVAEAVVYTKEKKIFFDVQMHSPATQRVITPYLRALFHTAIVSKAP